MNDYTYLSSTWAVPELDMDGEIVDCYRMEHEVPGWNSNTKWPQSALDILSAVEMDMMEGWNDKQQKGSGSRTDHY